MHIRLTSHQVIKMTAVKVNCLGAISILRKLLYFIVDGESCVKFLQLKNDFILEVERLFEDFEELEDKKETEEYLSGLRGYQLSDQDDDNYYMAKSQIYKIVELLGKKDIYEARVCQIMALLYMENIVYNKCIGNPNYIYLISTPLRAPLQYLQKI